MSDQAAAPERASPRDWIAVTSTMIGAFMAILDIQITNASLANIEGAVGASPSEGSWISTAYLMAEIVTIPLTGWLGRIVGLKRYLLINATLFLVFSLLCAASTSLSELILFRIGQGFTGGVLIPTALTVLRFRLPPSQLPIGIAVFGFVLTFAPTLGPTLGGWLTDRYSWHALFTVNLAPGILALVMMATGLDAAPARWNELRHGDWLGVALMATGFASLITVLENGEQWEWFGSDLIRVLSVTATVGVCGFIVRELMAAQPLINLRLLKSRPVCGCLLLTTVLGGVSLGSTYIIPLYCAEIQDYSPMQIGWVVMWAGLPQFVLFPMMPMLLRHIDGRLLVLGGTLLFAASCALNVPLTQDVGMNQLIFSQILRGISQPLFSGPLNQILTMNVRRSEMADTSALTAMTRNIGGSLCIAGIATMVDRREKFHFSMLAERLDRNSVLAQSRLHELVVAHGGDKRRALTDLARMVRQQAEILSFSDAFAAISLLMLVCLVALLMLRKPRQFAV